MQILSTEECGGSTAGWGAGKPAWCEASSGFFLEFPLSRVCQLCSRTKEADVSGLRYVIFISSQNIKKKNTNVKFTAKNVTAQASALPLSTASLLVENKTMELKHSSGMYLITKGLIVIPVSNRHIKGSQKRNSIISIIRTSSAPGQNTPSFRQVA